jgi:hypothetical protein
MLLSQQDKSNPKLKEYKENDNYKCEIWSGLVCLAFHESKSKTYAKKAAVKKAIISIVDASSISLAVNQNTKKGIVKKEKEEKHQLFLAKQAEKKAVREQKKQDKIDQKAANEKARRLAKERKKQRMLEREKVLRAQANQTMSGKKRRFLEDKNK